MNYNGSARIDYAGSAGDNSNGVNGVVVRTGYGICNIASVSDGTSNTIAVGEKRLNRSVFGTGTDDNEPYNRPGWNGDFDMYRLGNVAPAQDFSSSSTSPSTNFGSAHPSGFNAVFVDGSVRHIRYSVNVNNLRRACVVNDGQVYSEL
jgi:prepilin-type processing-associated H-X9-DG protein